MASQQHSYVLAVAMLHINVLAGNAEIAVAAAESLRCALVSGGMPAGGATR